MNERIKELRKALGLTQQKFADKIGVKQNTVAQYEMGRNQPIDTVITLICKEFNVNEDWLRYGDGKMFRPQNRNDELTSFMGDILKDDIPDFRTRLVSVLARLDTEEWRLLEKMARKLLDEMKKEEAGQ
ncbi:helix-turn-helix domain-containing protein [Acidaminococcus intestini]|uniref:helix-turn-helix domain-containing protein n=1 Tax=Acidaminococcus intestini TaxID=187327 RepID=UPI0027BA4EFD|nr:helix-turn-helix transcriptional regulator [Acidaminococcus intestini]